MIGYNNQSIKLSQYKAPISLYDKKYALHKISWGWQCLALFGPPTYCGAGQPDIFKWEGLMTSLNLILTLQDHLR